MCGILGCLHKEDYDLNLQTFKQITQSLINRGPDDEGYFEFYIQPNILKFGHKRLSIIELTNKARQPMESFSERFVIIFNGEIYNHLELREEIKHKINIKWQSSSDTETLVNLFEFFEFESVLNRLEGMFAFSLFDKKEKLLYLARDRAGEKPLYISSQDNNLSFASDLLPLINFNNFNKEINQNAVQKFFEFNYIPSPLTIYNSIFKLPPASFIKINTNRIKFNRTINFNKFISNKDLEYKKWWKFKKNNLSNYDDEKFINKTELLIENSVKKQLISDVPLGAFLSGGLDSALIVYFMQKFQNKTKTFTIGYDDPDLDESNSAKKTANFLQTDHVSHIVSKNEILNFIPQINSAFTEPFADSSQLPTMLVSKIAKNDVKVVLSGDGGDELFGGYNRYIYANKYWKYIKIFPTNLRKFIISLIPYFPISIILFIINKKIFKNSSLHFDKNKFIKATSKLYNISDDYSYYKSFTNEWYNNYKIFNFVPKKMNDDYFNLEKIFDDKLINFEEKMMNADFLTYLPDDILCKVDRSSMFYSLEARAPYLNKDLINFSYNLPFNLKIDRGRSKVVLKNIISKFFPKEILDRPKKGFAIPIYNLIRTDLYDWSNDILSDKIFKKHNFINIDTVNLIKKDHYNNKANNGYKLWALIQFNQWYINNFNI